MVETVAVTIQKPKSKGRIDGWLEKNDSRIKDFKYSCKLFTRSPLAMIGLINITIFVLIAIFAPYIAPNDPNIRDWYHTLNPPSIQHLFGTDDMGGDVFSRIIWGSRVSLYIGFEVVLISIITGAIVGSISGYLGGAIDELMMRITDIFLAFPGLILAMVICTALGRSIENVALALCITWWPSYARIIRGQVLSIREQKYIEAARTVGGTDRHIILRHVLPNSLSPIIVQSTMDLGNVILTAAALSYIGFGSPPGAAEWGRMVSDGSAFMMTAPWIVTFTGLAILIVCMSFNLLGDGIRDIMDPKMRR